MRVSKRRALRCVITAAVVLWVARALWQSQESARLCLVSDFDLPQSVICSFDSFERLAFGWPLPHTLKKETLESRTAGLQWVGLPSVGCPSVTSDQCERIGLLFPGMLIDVAAWCVIVAAASCVVWRWTANARQFRLGTLFSLTFVVAVLLGWWKYEHDARTILFMGQPVIVTLDLPPMLALLQFPWYVSIPVLFGLGCTIYSAIWVGGRIIGGAIRRVRHVAVPKLQRTD
jgi:hypothetical protein